MALGKIGSGVLLLSAASAGHAQPRPTVPLPRALPSASALYHAAYQRRENDWFPILYLCDGIDGNRVKLITTPNARGMSQLWTYAKPGFRTRSEIVRLGDEDPGAGQIYRELRSPAGVAFGSVHSINPGMLGNAATTSLPTLTSISDRNQATRCRWLPRAQLMLVDARRSIVVTRDGGGFTYRSFDHARPGRAVSTGDARWSVPTVTVAGGRLMPSRVNSEVYEFRRGPYTYRVTASADNRAAGASVSVLRGGRAIQTSVAAAYEMAAKRVE